MHEKTLESVLQLLKRSANSGIHIDCKDGELVLSSPKGKKPDPGLLNEIRASKDQLKTYFRDISREREEVGAQAQFARAIEVDGEPYYAITPVQVYWVNDEMDTAYKQNDTIHGTVRLAFRIGEGFDPECFRKAIIFLIRRHESLRATFRKINGEFYMKVEDAESAAYLPEFLNMDLASPMSEAQIDDYVSFRDLVFDFERGPLFLVRVLRTGPESYIFSIRMHHVLFDNWSNNVLFRDITIAYVAYSSGKEPVLPPLPYQYKDFMAMENGFLERNRKEHRLFWSGLCDHIPPSLLIPGHKNVDRDITERILMEDEFALSGEPINRLQSLARQFSASLFVILQASFDYFFYRLTGQKDIITGTYLLGRDYPDCRDQIGCYRKVELIRTVFSEGDTFPDAIVKVRQSNEDLQRYRGFSLKDLLEEMMPPERNKGSCFWNFNLQYRDVNPPAGKPPFDMKGYEGGHSNLLLYMDMEVRFLNFKEKIVLNVVYDGGLYDAATISRFFSEYLEFLQTI